MGVELIAAALVLAAGGVVAVKVVLGRTGPPHKAGYYVVPIVGKGSDRDPFRADLPPGTDHAAVIPSFKDGMPARDWALVYSPVAGLDTAPGVDPLPGLGDVKVDALSAAQQTKLTETAARRGVTVDPAVQTVADVVQAVGEKLDPAFTVADLGAG